MSSKWEREIEEVLRKKKFIEEDEPAPPPPPRPIRRREPRKSSGRWRRAVQDLSPSRLMWYGLGLGAAIYVLRPLFGPAVLFLALASVALIIAAVVVSVMQRESPYVEKRWRGQVIELPSRQRPISFTWRRFVRNVQRFFGRRG